jgi:hypothetical protein
MPSAAVMGMGAGLLGALLAVAPPPPRPLAPEVAATVDRLVGRWTFEVKVSFSGADKPAVSRFVYDCRRVALGHAVSCSGSLDVPGVGRVEEVSLVAYDPESKLVHMMTVNSGGDFHDHRGGWSGNTLELEAETTSGGRHVQERITFAVDDRGGATYRSVATLSDGASVTVQGAGHRTASR